MKKLLHVNKIFCFLVYQKLTMLFCYNSEVVITVILRLFGVLLPIYRNILKLRCRSLFYQLRYLLISFRLFLHSFLLLQYWIDWFWFVLTCLAKFWSFQRSFLIWKSRYFRMRLMSFSQNNIFSSLGSLLLLNLLLNL